MISELQAIFGPDLVPMLAANAIAALFGICCIIVALTSGAEVSRPAPRAPARI
jgi:hypothetical protein